MVRPFANSIASAVSCAISTSRAGWAWSSPPESSSISCTTVPTGRLGRDYTRAPATHPGRGGCLRPSSPDGGRRGFQGRLSTPGDRGDPPPVAGSAAGHQPAVRPCAPGRVRASHPRHRCGHGGHGIRAPRPPAGSRIGLEHRRRPRAKSRASLHTSRTSVLQLLVDPMQLFTGAVNREAPIDPHAIVVSLARPGAHLLVPGRQGADPPGEALGGERAEFILGDLVIRLAQPPPIYCGSGVGDLASWAEDHGPRRETTQPLERGRSERPVKKPEEQEARSREAWLL